MLRAATIAALFAALAMAPTATAQHAHHGRTLQQRATLQRWIIEQDQRIIAEYVGAHTLRTIENPRYWYTPGPTVRSYRYHRAQLRWTRRELRQTLRAIAAQKQSSSTRPGVDSCLSELIDRESGWNVHATNPVTGAYGLPQALPGSKMASAGADWHDNPATQIRWMLGYVSKYHGSCGALAFQKANGWY
jgi:hypothetical protein